MQDLEKYNGEVKAWGKKTRDRMKSVGRSMGITHRSDSPSDGDSLNKIRDRYKEKDGTVNEVRFSNVERSLIISSRGAGKGIGGSKGSSWLDKYGKRQKTNPASLNKIGSSTRKIKNFIGDTLDAAEGITELSEIAAVNLADAAVKFNPNDVLQKVQIKK